MHVWTLLMHLERTHPHISECDIVIFTFDWKPQQIIECIFFFDVDFIGWMDFEMIIKLIVSIGFVFIFIWYEWLHTPELCVNDSWSDIIHLLSLSVPRSLHLHWNCWFVVFYIAYFVNKGRIGATTSKTMKKKKVTRELLNLISKTIDTHDVISTSPKRVIAN